MSGHTNLGEGVVVFINTACIRKCLALVCCRFLLLIRLILYYSKKTSGEGNEG